MKVRTLLVSAILTLFAFSASAQAQNPGLKIGFVDTEYVLSQMPEAKQIQSELQAYQKQLTSKISATMQGFQQQLQQYQQNAATMTEQARQEKEQELQGLQQQIQQDQQEAQVSLQRKEGELLEPVYNKIQTNINNVAQQNNYTHVFSSNIAGNPVLVYVKDQEQSDISDLVLKAMGITPATSNNSGGK